MVFILSKFRCLLINRPKYLRIATTTQHGTIRDMYDLWPPWKCGNTF